MQISFACKDATINYVHHPGPLMRAKASAPGGGLQVVPFAHFSIATKLH